MAKRPSAKQIAARQRFAEMARARAASARKGRGGGSTGTALHSRAARGDGIVGIMIAGALASLWITGGKLASRAVPNLLKINAADSGGMAIAAGIQIAAGAGLAWAVENYVDRTAGELVAAGAFSGLLESALRRFNVPILSPLAGDEGDVLQGYTYELSEEPGHLPASTLRAMASGLGPLGLYPGAGMGSYVTH